MERSGALSWVLKDRRDGRRHDGLQEGISRLLLLLLLSLFSHVRLCATP